MSDFRTIVVPYDFSEHARTALDAAIDLGKRLESDLHLVHVVQTPAYAYGHAAYAGAGGPPVFDMGAVRDGARGALEDVARSITHYPGKIEHEIVEGLGVAVAIQEAAEKLEADMIVMGTHGRTGLAHVFLGSVAERTLRNAPCPVLTVQGKEEAKRESEHG